MNIIDNHRLLSSGQIQLLHTCCSKYFHIGRYQSIENLLASLNVDVLIEPGIITRSIPIELNDTKAFWREEVNRLEKLIPEAEDRDAAIEDYRDARNNLERISEDLESWASMPLRGLFVPKANIIKLYPEEMALEYNGACMDELLLSTLVHESMHAYFNRPRHKSYHYVIHVEEPLAEFGMLLFLKECNLCYNWAYIDVCGKRTCYRFGAKLMDQHLKEGRNSSVRQYLEAYKIKLDLYSMPKVNSVGGTVVLPKNHSLNSPIQVGGQMITPRWNEVFKYPPRYFYDQKTGTLGLDGDWSDWRKYDGSLPVRIDR